MSKQLVSLSGKLAARFGMETNEKELIDTLKATAFKQDGNAQITDAQMTAMLIVANQYGLNPWTKEIYAFPHKGSIVPIVGVDGWARIINDHPMFDGMDFQQDDESCTCRIHRKDRSHPVQVTEYLSECKKSNSPPWASHPRRMLRHKALIQCARLAFSYSGIYDEDEAERIIEKDITNGSKLTPPTDPVFYSDADFNANFPAWAEKIQLGTNNADRIIAMVGSKAPLTEEQKTRLRDVNAPIKGELA